MNKFEKFAYSACVNAEYGKVVSDTVDLLFGVASYQADLDPLIEKVNIELGELPPSSLTASLTLIVDVLDGVFGDDNLDSNYYEEIFEQLESVHQLVSSPYHSLIDGLYKAVMSFKDGSEPPKTLLTDIRALSMSLN